MIGNLAIASWTSDGVTLNANRETWEELATVLRSSRDGAMISGRIRSAVENRRGVIPVRFSDERIARIVLGTYERMKADGQPDTEPGISDL